MTKSNAILLIDGENFRHKFEEVLVFSGINKDSLSIENVDYGELFSLVLNDIVVSRKVFYSARLQVHENSEEKSKELIYKQRILKTNLEKQGFEFVIAGNVRPQLVSLNNKHSKVIFKEKGVDVRIAVDLVTTACDKTHDTVILCSSDSDLQPAVKEGRNRGLQIVYLGFEIMPNKGLGYTTNRTILFRNAEILEAYTKVVKKVVDFDTSS